MNSYICSTTQSHVNAIFLFSMFKSKYVSSIFLGFIKNGKHFYSLCISQQPSFLERFLPLR